MVFVAALMAWLLAHTDVMFADGLRYIRQAQALDRGSAGDFLKKAVDHPVYPLGVAAAHRVLGGDGPEAWQFSAQLASAAAAVLLVLPLYLVSRELLGDAAAAPGCFLFYAVPLTGHVFADTLSESTFLVFWATGLWAALRFLRTGSAVWLPAVVIASGLAYLTRPEGLLLPAALVVSMVMSPSWVMRGLKGRRGLVALGGLVAGSALVVVPYVVMKGGLGTKPSVARLLGTAPRSAPHAVERQRPLDPDQTAARTYALAAKAVKSAVTDAVTWPLIPLAVVGLWASVRRGGEERAWKLVGVIGIASILALARLHATGGYCSPRHALILAVVLIPSSAAGLAWLIGMTTARAAVPARLRSVAVGVAAACLGAWDLPATLAPVNEGLGGYRDAGRWLARRPGGDSKVIDVTGWSQFYGRQTGYTFEDLVAAPADPSARWVVAREAHLVGPWEYCRRLRDLVDGLEPVEVFAGSARHRKRATRVLVFDRSPRLAVRPGPGPDTARR
jgi:4-amino-4-deoxy-L-arabinose transferase-like glycosyltransferase